MEAMETVIEKVEELAPVEVLVPAEAAQTAVEVVTKKSGINAVKTGGIIAGFAALAIGAGYAIYHVIKGKKTVEVCVPDVEAETHEDNETDED